jgi:hypothetical protein
VIDGDFGLHTFGYVVSDLTKQADTVVHTFLPVPTDAVIPWGITWSQDSRWLALEPPSWDPVESGVWLGSADAATKSFLGIGTKNPIWIDEDYIVFSTTIDGEARLQLYSIATDERCWLDVPVGARAVQHVADKR